MPEAKSALRALAANASDGQRQSPRTVLALPFDTARHRHAAGVRFGAWPRALVESQRFEQRLGLLESLWLGPLARHR